MRGRRNRSSPKLGPASDPLIYPWTNAQLGAGAGAALGQPGAAGSLVNQAPAFEASASSLGEPEQLDLLAAGSPPPWSGVSRSDGGLIYGGL